MYKVLFWILFVGGAISIVVFAVSFRYTLSTHTRREGSQLPRAELLKSTAVGRSDRARAASKHRAMRAIGVLQAGLVAFGITAIVFMVLCLVGAILIWGVYS